jgi:LemA protein
MSLLLIIVVVGVLAALYGWYASIVGKKNKVAEALSGVDVQLTQRHDLIPNLLAIAKRFMEHERGLLDEITALRAKAAQGVGAQDPKAVADKFAAESALDASVGKLFAVAENYPQLKSDGPMLEAQRAYQEVETNIAASRRFYNASVTELRNSTQVFPGNILAGMAGVTAPPPFFEAQAADRAPVDAAAHL